MAGKLTLAAAIDVAAALNQVKNTHWEAIIFEKKYIAFIETSNPTNAFLYRQLFEFLIRLGFVYHPWYNINGNYMVGTHIREDKAIILVLKETSPSIKAHLN